MSSSEVKELNVEKTMTSQNQESLENEHISLLHEKILQVSGDKHRGAQAAHTEISSKDMRRSG